MKQFSRRAGLITLLVISLCVVTQEGHAQTLMLKLNRNAGTITLSFSGLTVGTNYQLQAAGNLTAWTNQGTVFTATNANWVYPQDFTATNASQFFRLQAVWPAIYDPVFFDPDSGGYYALRVRGSLGNEYLEIDATSQTNATPWDLFNPDSGQFYTLMVSGNVGLEMLNIVPSSATSSAAVYLFNPDSSAYYRLTVNGTAGNEFLPITKT